MTERNETSQLEELKRNYPWKKLKVAKRTEENQAEEDGSADNGADNGSVTRKEGTKTPRKTWDQGDSQKMNYSLTSR